jgi:hypothetical protein
LLPVEDTLAFLPGTRFRTHVSSVHPSAKRQPQTINSISSSFATQRSEYIITVQHQEAEAEEELPLKAQCLISTNIMHYFSFLAIQNNSVFTHIFVK